MDYPCVHREPPIPAETPVAPAAAPAAAPAPAASAPAAQLALMILFQWDFNGNLAAKNW